MRRYPPAPKRGLLKSLLHVLAAPVYAAGAAADLARGAPFTPPEAPSPSRSRKAPEREEFDAFDEEFSSEGGEGEEP